MTEIELVIKIPEKIYKHIREMQFYIPGSRDGKSLIEKILKAIRIGTPLPKEHGKLSDMDELVKNIVKEYDVNSIHELPQDIKMFYDKFINSAPTILNATVDYKLKNYAFLERR